MSNRELFDKYYSRLALEGWLKSLVIAAVFGFAASAVVAFIAILNNANGVLISILVLLAVTALTTVAIYFLKFKPDTDKIAERVDRLGLEERSITMLELENDESYIAMRQREDAKAKIAATSDKKIKVSVLSLPIVAFILLAVFATMSISTITVSALSVDARKPYTRSEDWRPKVGEEISVRFVVAEGGSGYILGDTHQIVPKDGSTTTVFAVADVGYTFAGWSDGVIVPERAATNVNLDSFDDEGNPIQLEELVFEVKFKKVVEGDGENGEPEKPTEVVPSEDQGGKRDPEDPEDERLKEENQFLNGNTYYGDEQTLADYYEKMLQDLALNPNISPELRAYLEAYFKMLGAQKQ